MAVREREWRRDVEAFVLRNLSKPPAKVLEVGCGAGDLAIALDAAGFDITAIDPKAPEGPNFQGVTLEEFTPEHPFDFVIASLSLHHIADVAVGLDRMMQLLAANGTVVISEFGWDRLDEATARWCLQRLPTEVSEDAGFLYRRFEEWQQARRDGRSLAFHEHWREWAVQEGLHPSPKMLTELRARFEETYFEWGPYLYSDLEDTPEAEERAAIEARSINAIGFRFVGTL